MNRAAQNLVLLLLGGAVLDIALDGTYLRYVKPGLQPYLILSGVVLLALAAVAIVRDIRKGWAATDSEHPGRAQWLLLAPIAALLVIVPPALGATSVRSGTTAQAAVDSGDKFAFPPLPSGPAPTVRMADLLDRAAYDSSGELDRREITVVGFIVHTETGVDLARVVITCCVADAQTMSVHLGGDFDSPPDDTWVSVRGKAVPDSARPETNMTPTLDVLELRTVPAPARVYG
ncbi:TIGR03943 family putative permease subunit [Nocardia sp. NPDC004068]|uniref:TIGR03943 family putative permease subunit n=1 Tax=Nocardia sp. NPDC004068 TaxID=3364303 RepID=UPI00367FE643